jgi:hypothetical protein
MSIISRSFITYLTLCGGLTLAFDSVAFGGEIFQKDFSQAADSVQADISGMEMWTGDPLDSWGKITLEALPAGVDGSPKKALTVATNSTSPNAPDGSKFCPSITVKTPGCGPKGEKKTAVFLLRFLVPIDGAYRTDIHFGGNWESNATILVLNGHDLNAMVQGTPTKMASYAPNTWQELQVEFDCANKTFSILQNGTRVANGIPWNDHKLDSVDSLVIVAGAMPVQKDGTPVFYLQKVDVSEK